MPRDGVYTFSTQSDDGSKLYIHNLLVVKNDGVHPLQSSSGKITLKAGKHPFVLEYQQNKGYKGLQLFYEGPNLTRKLVPASALYRKAPLNSARVASAILEESGPEFTVYPVPASNEVNVSFDISNNPTSVWLTDAFAKQVVVNRQISETTIKFDLANVTPGIYYLIIQSDAGSQTKKISIVK